MSIETKELAPFEVQKDKTYLILEKVTKDSPESLQKIGRSKMGGYFSEWVGCPFIPSSDNDLENGGYYDTGFKEFSPEFVGMSDAEVKKILKDREELTRYYESVLAASGKTEKEFLATYKLEIKHNLLLNTRRKDIWLKLYFAMRSTRLCADRDKGNVLKYGNAMYVLVDQEVKKDFKQENAKKKVTVQKWMYDLLDKDKTQLLDYLKYLGWVSTNTGIKEDYTIVELIENKITTSFEKLTEIYDTIKTVSYKDIKVYNDVVKAFNKGLIVKENKEFLFNFIPLGSTLQEVAKNIQYKKNQATFEEFIDKVSKIK
jgi:hypothetical protein